jgi:hypothetical protein
MIAIALIVIVAGGGLVYLLLRMLDMAEAQRNFCMITTMIALCLGVLFGENAIAAAIAIMVFGMGGLLVIDRRVKAGQPSRQSAQVDPRTSAPDEPG